MLMEISYNQQNCNPADLLYNAKAPCYALIWFFNTYFYYCFIFSMIWIFALWNTYISWGYPDLCISVICCIISMFNRRLKTISCHLVLFWIWSHRSSELFSLLVSKCKSWQGLGEWEQMGFPRKKDSLPSVVIKKTKLFTVSTDTRRNLLASEAKRWELWERGPGSSVLPAVRTCLPPANSFQS